MFPINLTLKGRDAKIVVPKFVAEFVQNLDFAYIGKHAKTYLSTRAENCATAPEYLREYGSGGSGSARRE